MLITRGSLVRVQPALPAETNPGVRWTLVQPDLPVCNTHRGISSAGRAPALQAGGRRFDPVILHQDRAGGSSLKKRLEEAKRA